jgi:hypothetical protein
MVMESSQERRSARTGRPPRRWTDRIEDAVAWLLFAGGLFVVLVGATTAVAVHGDAVERGRDVVLTAPGHIPAGTPAGVWVDLDGRPTTAPPTRTQAVAVGIAAGVGVVVLGGVVLGGMSLGVRRWLLARNAAAWTREWALVEPEWSRRAR